MPHLLIRGVSPDHIRTISKALITELAGICECPEDYITLDCLHTTACFDGAIVPSFPFIEVNWFERGSVVRDRAAECIDRHVRSLGLDEVEVAFRTYEQASYYSNGVKLSVAGSEETVAALQLENLRLKEELQKVRKMLQSNQTSPGSYMSSKLYDALRE